MYSENEYNALLQELQNERREKKRLSLEIKERNYVITSFESQENLYNTLKTQKDYQDTYLDMILDNIQDIIVMLDINRNFIFGTKNNLKTMGLNAEALTGNDFFEDFSQIASKTTTRKMTESFQSVLEKKEILKFNECLTLKDGNIHNFAIAFIPVKNKKETLNGIMLSFHDITSILPPKPSSIFEIEGIDAKAGINAIGGNEELYKALLPVFLKESSEKMSQVKEILGKDDMNSYIVYLHALKSSLYNIGSYNLSEFAKSLEYAGRNGDKEYIEQNTSEFLSKLATQLETVRNVITKDEALFERVKTYL